MASACAAGSTSRERFPVGDLLREPGQVAHAREVPPGTREEQMQDLALTLREAVGSGADSVTVEGESLVVVADANVLRRVRALLAEMRRLTTQPQGR